MTRLMTAYRARRDRRAGRAARVGEAYRRLMRGDNCGGVEYDPGED